MIQSTSTQSSIDRFWDKFIARLLKNGVKQEHTRWYVFRAEQYIKAFPDKRLAEHSEDEVTHYLESAGRIGGISDWQFVQLVDAIQNLLLTAGLALAVDTRPHARRVGTR